MLCVQQELTNDWQALGVGLARDGADEAYFVAVHWPAAQRLRTRLRLPEHHLHITLGFRSASP